MELVTPGIGLIFWTTLAFLIVLFLLGKFGWKPILKMIKEREETIESSLKAAERAKKEMEALQSENEKLLAEARKERDTMIKEAKETKDKMISDAKSKAREEGDQMISQARREIENQKQAAVAELKDMVAKFSVEIAEKILRKELKGEGKQKELVNDYMDDVKLN